MKGKIELHEGMTTNDLKTAIAEADGVDIIKAWNEEALYEQQLESTILSTLSQLTHEDYEGNISDNENDVILTLNQAIEIASNWTFNEEEDENLL